MLELGVKKENILMVDSQGVISTSRSELNEYKLFFSRKTDAETLADALIGADVFVGVSQGNIVTPVMLQSMAKEPIIFAMANPTPEIAYDSAIKAVSGCIMATGRSDYPNQVNNVLGFPFIFRGALDTRATTINIQMKLAAVKALAALAHEKVPATVVKAYGKKFTFGKDYIIPKPFDPRLLYTVAPAVAKAAMDSGVAQKKIDVKKYVEELKKVSLKLAAGKF